MDMVIYYNNGAKMLIPEENLILLTKPPTEDGLRMGLRKYRDLVYVNWANVAAIRRAKDADDDE